MVDPDDLMENEKQELWHFYTKYKKALTELFGYEGRLNFSYLANNKSHGGHCHWHIVPRYFEPRTFEGVEFIDPTPESLWTSKKMDEELVLALKDKIKAVLN